MCNFIHFFILFVKYEYLKKILKALIIANAINKIVVIKKSIFKKFC